MKRKAFGLFAVLCFCFQGMAATTYQATWTSVNQHTAAPEWFKDAKFGIYFHWGVFSVPAFSSEWYPRNMYNSGSSEYNHHVATFGDPKTAWPYQNFINGANDKNGVFTQFNPKLKSAGGNFDPDAWAQLFMDAGAKFAGPVAEHHDGFSMWNSTVNEWNSVAKGPQLDLASIFATAIRAKGLKFMMSMHHAYNFTGYYQYAPTQTDASLKKLFGQLDSVTENQLWYNKLKEIIDNYQPDLIWEDFNLNRVSEAQRLIFLSYYFNKAIDWGKEVVATYKDGFNTNGEVLDYERGGPAAITTPYWLTDDAVSSSSWCYTTGLGYYTTTQELDRLIDVVSKGGNLLLNISPMADGTIPQKQIGILDSIGDWLKRYGEAIYSTRAWEVYGEGPTKMGGGSFTAPVAGTNKDIRFTRDKGDSTLYAIVLGWPGNGAALSITSLNAKRFSATGLNAVMLPSTAGGTPISLTYTQDTAGLKITMPSAQPYTALAYVIKMKFGGQVPHLGCTVKNAFSQIEAESFDASSGAVKAETCNEGGQNLGYITTGDWVYYCSVDFKNGAQTFNARVGTNTSTSTGKIDIRLDSANGKLVGSLTGSGPGGYQNYATKSCTVTGASGVHDLYLVFQAGYNVNWFSFTQASGVEQTESVHAAASQSRYGRLCFRDAIVHGAMPVPSNAKAVEFYSLQGKLLFRHAAVAGKKVDMQEAVGKLPSSIFYIKFDAQSR